MEIKGEDMKKAFTMIELVMVIVVLGILSSVAISKMALTRDDALITKGKSQVSSIRSAITLLRSKNMMSGKMSNGGYPSKLDALSGNTSSDGETLFDYDSNSSDTSKRLLDYPIYSKSKSGWRKVAKNKYTFNVIGVDINFTYTPSSGSFDCNHSSSDTKIKELCKSLTE